MNSPVTSSERRWGFITPRSEHGCLIVGLLAAVSGIVANSLWLTLAGGWFAGFFTCASLYTWATRAC